MGALWLFFKGAPMRKGAVMPHDCQRWVPTARRAHWSPMKSVILLEQ